MDQLLCEKSPCKNSATKFCINCRAYLCAEHVIEDVKVLQQSSSVEHYHTDAYDYRDNNEKYSCLYCEEHKIELLSLRCINCSQFACNSCPPQWCAKAPGRYHDYDMLSDLECGYKNRLSELCLKLQEKQMTFRMQLEKMYSEIEKPTEEGKGGKQEIDIENSQYALQMEKHIKFTEEKESMSQKLVQDICRILDARGSSMAILNYKRINKEVNDLFKLRSTYPESPILSPSQVKKTEIIQQKIFTDDRQWYWGLNFCSKDKIVACGWDKVSGEDFIETRKDETHSRQMYGLWIIQLLPYGNQLLVLSGELYNNTYRITFHDRETVLYEFTDSPDYYSPYNNFYSHRLMAVYDHHQLIVLQEETQIFHGVNLETNEENEINLSVGKRVYGVMASPDNKLILLCEQEGEEERKHSVIKYDPKLLQIIWDSTTLLTEHLLECSDKLTQSNRLNFAAYKGYLYVLSRCQPKKLFRLNLTDGKVVREILYDGFPSLVEDISLRGNILCTASYEIIMYYKIADIT